MTRNDGVNPWQDGCVFFGGLLVVFLPITGAAAGLGLTGDVSFGATIIPVQSKTKDPAPKAGNQRTFRVGNIRLGKRNEEKKSKCTGIISFSCTLLWSSMH